MGYDNCMYNNCPVILLILWKKTPPEINIFFLLNLRQSWRYLLKIHHSKKKKKKS